jgi:L-ribulose-5-phosphate 4-epimerase
MLTELKREAYEANLALPRHGLVHLNFGNASALDRGRGIFAIKPSGVDYPELRPATWCWSTSRAGGSRAGCGPSSDTPTHLELYRGFAQIGGIVHTHSVYATAFAQAGRPIPALGTTHADFFRAGAGDPPADKAEIEGLRDRDRPRDPGEVRPRLDPEEIPGVLVHPPRPVRLGAHGARRRWRTRWRSSSAPAEIPAGPPRPALSAQARPRRLLRPGGERRLSGGPSGLPASRAGW